MCPLSWTIESALWQIVNGEQNTPRTESATNWLYGAIATEAQSNHPLLTGAMAEMILDKLVELVKGNDVKDG